MDLLLQRVMETERGTFGALALMGRGPFCLTLEPPWRDNLPNVSCIPAGFYPCRRYGSERYPDTWEIAGVANRSKVIFHRGNWLENTEGCVLLGERYEFDGRGAYLRQSAEAFEEFMKLTGAETTLRVVVRNPGWREP